MINIDAQGYKVKVWEQAMCIGGAFILTICQIYAAYRISFMPDHFLYKSFQYWAEMWSSGYSGGGGSIFIPFFINYLIFQGLYLSKVKKLKVIK